MTRGQESEIISVGSKISAHIMDILDCRIGRKIIDSLSDDVVISIQEEIESKVMDVIASRLDGIKSMDGGITEEDILTMVKAGKVAIDIARCFDVPLPVVRYRIDKLKEQGWI